MKNIGLYFGSFNPIHLGHLIIGEHLVQHHPLDEIWYVVSPQNPFKEKEELADENHRAKMVKIATKGNKKLKLSIVEFSLPKPSYTIKTLEYVQKTYPNKNFSIVMGEDNIMKLHKWKSFEEIIANFPIFIYPRLYKSKPHKRLHESQFPEEIKSGNYTVVDAPIIQLSSTAIRSAIKDQQSVKYQVREQVIKYINEHDLYRG